MSSKIEMKNIYKTIENSTQKLILRNILSEHKFQVTSFIKTTNEYIFDIRDKNNTFTTVKVNSHYRFFSCECGDLTDSEKRNIVCQHICFIVFVAGGIYPKKFIKVKIIDSEDLFLMIKNIEAVWKRSFLSIIKDCDERLELKNPGCAICYEDFHIREEHKIRDIFNITTCKNCKNLLHVDCMNKWLSTNDKCIFCRIKWLY